MTIGTDINRIEGSTVYDSTGDKVGKVGQVYLDDQTQQPTWVTVSTGFFGTSETFVPIEGARFEGDDIHVGFDKAKIKDAPRVEVDQHLSETEEAELYRYYGLEWGSGYATDTTTTGTTTDTARHRVRRHDAHHRRRLDDGVGGAHGRRHGEPRGRPGPAPQVHDDRDRDRVRAGDQGEAGRRAEPGRR